MHYRSSQVLVLMLVAMVIMGVSVVVRMAMVVGVATRGGESMPFMCA